MKYVSIKVDSLLIISMILVIIGGIDWLTMVWFGFNIIQLILGRSLLFNLIVCIAMGLASLYLLYPLYQMIRYPNEE